MSVQKEDLAPFKHRNGFGPGGINVDIMSAIAHEVGAEIDFKDYSIAEGREKFLDGEVTIDCCLNEVWFPNQSDYHIFSDPIYHLIEVFVFPKGKVFPVPTTKALKDKTVIGIAGFTYPGQENYGKRIDGKNPREVLDLLIAGKGDVAVMERHAASFYINNFKFKAEYGDPYYSVKVGVRLHKTLAHRLDDINKAIEKIKKNGVVDTIIQRNIR